MNQQTNEPEYFRLYGEVAFTAHRQTEYIATLEARVRELEERLAAEMNLHNAPETERDEVIRPWTD